MSNALPDPPTLGTGRRKFRPLPIIVGVVAVACVGLAVMAFARHRSELRAAKTVTNDHSPSVDAQQASGKSHVDTGNQDISAGKTDIGEMGRPTPPPEMSEWYRWTELEKLHFVTSLQTQTDLGASTLAFLQRQMHDKGLSLVTRNNIGNVLVAQSKKDPRLAAEFKSMAEDSTDDEQWRDYSVQFVGLTLDWSDSRRDMADFLWKSAQSAPGTIAGTALLHLHYADQRGAARLPYGYEATLAGFLDNPLTNLSTRMTAASIAGERKMASMLPRLENLAERSELPSLRRSALAAIGKMGNKSELDFVRKYVNDADPLVALAARGAERSLGCPIGQGTTSISTTSQGAAQ